MYRFCFLSELCSPLLALLRHLQTNFGIRYRKIDKPLATGYMQYIKLITGFKFNLMFLQTLQTFKAQLIAWAGGTWVLNIAQFQKISILPHTRKFQFIFIHCV